MKYPGADKNLKPFTKGFDERRNLVGPPPIIRECKELLTEDLSPEDATKQLNKLVKTGNVRAIELYFERVWGRVRQTVDIEGNLGIIVKLEDGSDD